MTVGHKHGAQNYVVVATTSCTTAGLKVGSRVYLVDPGEEPAIVRVKYLDALCRIQETKVDPMRLTNFRIENVPRRIAVRCNHGDYKTMEPFASMYAGDVRDELEQQKQSLLKSIDNE